ncbi:sentrin-specific protease 7 isoform X8 [Columba livia]|uniref:sentrin-specific protease 7 isoform X8 n=1 Tax=Columba livia TaxID=8932 RepID=UPI0031BB6BEA
MEGRTSSSSHVSFRIPKKKTKSEDIQVQSPLARLPGSHRWDYPLKEWKSSANNREPSTKGKRQKDCDRPNSNDEESVGQPTVTLTNVLRTKIGRKYIDSHVIIDADLSDADKLQSGQLPSSSAASLQTCQILSPPRESSFLSERSERCLRKTDDDLCKLTKASKEPEKKKAFTFRRRELQKKENKNYDELEKRSRNMNGTTLSQKESGSFDSEKRKRRCSGYISDDCNAHIPEKSLLLSKEQRLSSAQSPGCRTPCEDEQSCRSNAVLVLDCIPQPLEREYKDTSTHNHLQPSHSCTEEPVSESPTRNLSEKQLSASAEDVISPQVSTIKKLKMDTSQYFKLRNKISTVVLSSDDEDEPSEPKCTELVQDNITDNKETDEQADCFSAKRLEDNMESHTQQVLTESIENKCPITLPSGSTPRKQVNPTLDVEFDNLYIRKFKWLSTGPARFTTKYITIPFQVALNKNIKLTVDTLDLRRFGLWRNDSGCSSTTIIFLWLSVDYVEKIETQLGKLVINKPSKSSEFVFLELSQPLTECDEDKLTELITYVSKKNRAPDLPDFLSLKQALPLFKDLSPEESSFMSYSKDLLKQYLPKENTSGAHEPAVQESKPKVARPSYALANKQNSGCYCISLSSALNEEWKEVRETGAVKNLIVYPAPPAKGGLGVTREDLECLEYGEFLNDVIIDFYLKYLLLEKVPKHLADRTHIFSSFFYKCLTRTEKNSEGDLKVSQAQKRHRRVKTWTRRINIFSKDYIFVPVNEESHWYVAVICFPWLEEPVYEECPHQNSLYHQPQQSPLQSECEMTRTGSVLAFPGNRKDEEIMDANRSLFSKGGNEGAASASDLDSGISKISLSNSKRQICKRPCILILDSLKAGSVQKTVQVLREYLEVEWEAKRKTHREFNKSTMIDLYPRVPKQNNSSDCGVYLLQYVESFLQNPIVNFEQPLHLEDWFPRQLIRSKREEIRDLILQLHFQQHSGSSS